MYVLLYIKTPTGHVFIFATVINYKLIIHFTIIFEALEDDGTHLEIFLYFMINGVIHLEINHLHFYQTWFCGSLVWKCFLMCVKVTFSALIPQNKLINKCHRSPPSSLISIPSLCVRKQYDASLKKKKKKAKDSFLKHHMDLNLLRGSHRGKSLWDCLWGEAEVHACSDVKIFLQKGNLTLRFICVLTMWNYACQKKTAICSRLYSNKVFILTWEKWCVFCPVL